MSSNDPGLNPSDPTASNTTPPQDHVNLRVTYLLPGNPRPPHDLGSVPVAATVLQLKSRIQSEILEHPSPEEQRLIYQGRPLLQNDMTLREALRLDGTSIGSLPYTIHIIIQSRHSQSNPSTHPLNPLAQITQQQPNPNPIRPEHNLPTQQAHQAQAMAQAQAVQGMLQTQLSMLQQQLSMLNPNVGQNITHMPNGMNATLQINRQPLGMNGQAIGAPSNLPQPFPPNSSNMPNFTNPQNNLPRDQAANLHGGNQSIINLPNQPSRNTTVRETIGPNGERIRTVINGSMNIQFGGRGMPNPLNRPSSAPENPSPNVSNTQPNLPSQGPLSTSITESRQLPIPTNSTQPPLPFQNTVGQNFVPMSRPPTLAWLASSPRGPEAIIFAPNHGYFTSVHSNPQAQSSSANPSLLPSANVDGRTEPSVITQPQTNANANTNLPANGQAALQPQLPVVAPNQFQPPAQNQNQNQDDIFGFVVQRGWLFVRLYMFTFVLSEPGTWRRMFLLTVAVIICLLPRRNPIYDMMEAARRHVDNLIGPPQPRPQPQPQALEAQNRQRTGNDAPPQTIEQQQVQQNGATDTRTVPATADGGSALAAPQRGNPNIMRDMFYRLEQSTALFLASLIPGVGERHVRAREEARRELQRQQREEELRQAAEVEAAATAVAAAADEGQVEEVHDQKHDAITDMPAKERGNIVSSSDQSQFGTSSSIETHDGAILGGSNEVIQRPKPSESLALHKSLKIRKQHP